MRGIYFIIILFLLPGFICYSQSTVSLQGQVITPNKTAVSFANVALMNASDSLICKGTTTDEKGNFTLEKLKNGNYYLQVYFIGFKTARVDSILINGRSVNLKPVILHQKSTQLEEIEVISEKGMFESQAGKMIYNVEGNLNAVGESAMELLQNIPSLSVDMDDKVTLRGSKATILIDGIESDLSSMLDQIPSDAIESIEVITNPSARYESRSGAGIVNVKLKKSAKIGYNGKIGVGLGTREKRNMSAQLGYSLKKWRLGTSLNYKKDKLEDDTFTERETLTNGALHFMNQDRFNVRTPSSAFFSTTANYYFDGKDFVNFQYVLQHKSQEYNSDYETEQFNADHVLTSRSTTDREGKDNNLFNQFNTAFRKNFKKDETQVLDLNLLYSFNTPLNQYDQLQQPVSVEQSVPVNNYTTDLKDYSNKIHLLKLKADYCQPLFSTWKLEVGALASVHHFYQDLYSERISYRRIKNSVEYTESSKNIVDKSFDYYGYAFSTYGLLSGRFGKFILSAGLRFEQTINQTKTEEKINNTFYKLIPSLHLKQTVSKDYSREFSYTSRISPPNYSQLNPISLSWGNYFESSGNPNLKPEVFYQAELANHWIHKKNNFVLTGFFKNRSNIIGRWYTVEQDDEGRDVTRSISENLGDIISTGIDGSAIMVANKFVFRPAISGYFSKISGDKFGPELDREEFSYTSKISSDYKINKDMIIQFSGRYSSPFISDYGKQYSYYTFDAGFRANFLKRAASFSLKVVDLFNTMEYDKVVKQRVNYTINNHVDPHNFLVYFDLTYKFNSLTTKKKL